MSRQSGLLICRSPVYRFYSFSLFSLFSLFFHLPTSSCLPFFYSPLGLEIHLRQRSSRVPEESDTRLGAITTRWRVLPRCTVASQVDLAPPAYRSALGHLLSMRGLLHGPSSREETALVCPVKAHKSSQTIRSLSYLARARQTGTCSWPFGTIQPAATFEAGGYHNEHDTGIRNSSPVCSPLQRSRCYVRTSDGHI